ncbi:MAG: LysM peptidoglycan-binding domain-containing protein [Bacteroidia bacterium]|nr:LysM peptidoglycan-binding domain-containing protein [Bacteroidia bacterium]
MKDISNSYYSDHLFSFYEIGKKGYLEYLFTIASNNFFKISFSILLLVFTSQPGFAQNTSPKRETYKPVDNRVQDETLADQIYVVRRGDWLRKIAYEFNVTEKSLMTLNGIKNRNEIQAGDTLIIRKSRAGVRVDSSRPIQTTANRNKADYGRSSQYSSTRPGKYAPTRTGESRPQDDRPRREEDSWDDDYYPRDYDYYSEEDIFYSLRPETQDAILRLNARLGDYKRRQTLKRERVQRNFNRGRSRGDTYYDRRDAYRRSYDNEVRRSEFDSRDRNRGYNRRTQEKEYNASRVVRLYRVRGDDTLASIAIKFGNTTSELVEINELDSSYLRKGRIIKVLEWQ